MINYELLDSPWLITEPAFHELHSLSRNAEFVTAALSFLDQFHISNNERPPYDIYGSVAVISCVGIFSKRASWWSWRFTGDRIQFAVTHAIQNPIIKSIVLDIDSPGGTVSGTMELAEYIFQARKYGKRIIAIANETCASAALWVGTSAHELVTTPTARSGSLGVVVGRYDYTGMNKRMGLKVHMFASGSAKTYGNPDTPMTDGERSHQQETVAVYAKQFIDGVARNRGVTPEDARTKWADARVWIGQAAVDVGLCDRVATLDSVVAELSGQPNVTVSEKGNPEDGQPGNPDARSGSNPSGGNSQSNSGPGRSRYRGSRIVERRSPH